MRVAAATAYLLLGEFYLFAHYAVWSPYRSFAVFVTLLASAVIAVKVADER